MMNEKISIDLKGVPQTLLLPLLGRAKFSKAPYSPIHDAKAIQLASTLNYDFDQLLTVSQVKYSTLFWMARAYHFDQAIKAYLKRYPQGTIVNLGCGLDTTFDRVDNGELTWIDIDLPEVIQLRRQLLPPSEREHYIAKSILDFSWMHDVQAFGTECFFFAGGVFMYFTPSEVKSLFIHMANQFPKAGLIFDNISPKGLKHANEMLKKSNMSDAHLQWSLAQANVLETWSPAIKVLNHMPYFKNIKSKFSFPLSLKLTMFIFNLMQKDGIIQVQFSN